MNDPQAERDTLLANLFDQAMAELKTGGTIDLASWQARHPELADDLPPLLATLRDLDTAVDDWKSICAAPETGPLHPEPQTPDSQPRGESLPMLSGQVGRYRILEQIGSGGMGTVYKARDTGLERLVALKVPRFDGPQREKAVAVQRFLREARAAAQVRHPHVCPIFDVGEHEGTPYTVMAYIEGPSLATVLKQGRLDVPRAVELARKVALGLEAVHQQGIVHRDLKPANILLDPAGEPLLTDFGLARSEQDCERLTADGALLGTPGYMAPEQASLKLGPVGPWTDIYSLGVVLYRMLAGRLPFEGNLLTVIDQIAHETPPPPSRFREDLDCGLERIVLKAIARQPGERYPSARAFAESLEQWTVTAQPSTGVQELVPTRASKRAATVVRTRTDDGEIMTVKVHHSAETAGDVRVTVRDRKGTARRQRRLTVSISLTFTLFLAVISAFLFHSFAVHKERQAERQESRKMQGDEALRARRQARREAARAAAKRYIALAEKVELDRAIALCRAALALDPKYAKAQNNLGIVLQKKGQLEQAIACFEKALALDPKFALAHNALGNALQAKGQLDQAIACFEKALAIDPKFTLAHYNLGNALKVKGQLDRAIACYQRALTLDPRSAQVHVGLGTALHAKGQLEGAIACYRKALALDPKYALSQNNLGNALHELGRREEAIACYQKAIALDPKEVLAHNNLGIALQAKGRLDEAIACYRKAIALNPKLASAHNNLGVALKKKGRLDQAIAALNKAVRLDPKQPSARLVLGEVLLKKGKNELAITAFTTAIELDPKLAPAYYMRSIAYSNLGEESLAKEDHDKAIEIDPKVESQEN
jgi:tetratricopeptide (TPR) repeat protein/serine/threonine protein kinase